MVVRFWRTACAAAGRVSGGLAGLLLACVPADAIDLLPFDYVPAPAGTTALLGYYIHSSADRFETSSGTSLNNGTGLDVHVGALRLTRYEEIAGVPVAAQLILPYGTLRDGQLGGFALNEPTGFLDPTLTLAFWPVNQPEQRRWLAVANYLTFPLGDHERGKALSLGENRWRNDLQVGLVQGLPGGFTLDLTADWIVYGDNDEAGTGNQNLTQSATFEAYAWLSYSFDAGSWAAVGYQGSFGGKQEIDGVPTGQATKFQQLRVGYGQFVTPTVQLVGTLGHDISASGTFERDYVLQFRILKLF